MPSINMSEIILLVVLAVIIFGPEKLPELARKTARLVVFLRGVANNAQDTVRRELGPEYADLTLADLQPKNLARRVLADDYATIEGEIRSVGTELSSVSQEFRGQDKQLSDDVAALRAEIEALKAQAAARDEVARTAVVVAPERNQPRFDDDAT